MKNLGDRLLYAMAQRSISQSELARKIEVSPQSIQYICSGKAKKSGHTASIARVLGISPNWLEKGIGKMELTEENTYESDKNINQVPLISWVQAGSWSEISDIFQPSDASDFYPCPERNSSSTFALTVLGESMSPEFINGEIIFVDPEVGAKNGSCVVVRQNGNTEATFKQLIIDGSAKYLKALNPNWPSPIIEMLPDARVCGVVIGSYRKRN
ncbi:S24 family peptidase [uncultured Psychrosphaera sp.]|uniref:LexA family protein n=1 Tax=uncultured Psychrosphaera sp. TaxID=1403522 RepID=UPI0026236CF4|nr:S24 family peptidase [uncultured Psychrosphaera sp.]